MTIKTGISFREYCRLLFTLVYKRPMMKVIVGVGLVVIVWILAYQFHFLPVPRPRVYQYITLTLIALVQPIVIFWTIKRSYESSNHLGEKLEINITDTKLKITGTSFYMELFCDKLFKIQEAPKYILLYQNTLSAIIISKKDLSKAALNELRKILESIPKVPKHLQETG